MTRLPSILAVLATLGLAACAAPEADEQEQALTQSEQRAAEAAQTTADPTPALPGSCDATQVQWTVGKAIGEAETEQARKDAGAATVRVLKPGQPVTMEFNGTRLNIEVDDKGVGVSARCG